MMISIIISKNVVTFLESVHKFKIQMIQKQSFTIYFKKSSSTRAPPSHEAKKASQMCGQILILQQIELSIIKSTPWIKGQMLCQVWVVLALRTRQWPTLICRVATLIRTHLDPMQIFKNWIDNKYTYNVKLFYNLNKNIFLYKVSILFSFHYNLNI